MEEEMPLKSIFHFGLIYRVIDSVILFTVLLGQNCTLTYFLTYFNDGNHFWYFMYLIDFILGFLFMFGAIFASRHYQKLHIMKSRRIRSSSIDQNAIESNANNSINKSSRHGIFNISFPQRMGTLPLLWINWILYSVLIVIKIFILYLQEIALTLYKSSSAQNKANDKHDIEVEPHTLKLCLASMTIVFLLWIELHRNHNSNQSQSCIKELTTSIVFEIFDSIDLLDLLLPDDHQFSSRPFLPTWLSVVTIILVAFNLLLPTCGLFELCQHNFVSHKFGLKTNIFHHSMRVGLINIPYMFLRIYFWKTEGRELSIFLLKNAISLFVSIRLIITDVNILRKIKTSKHRKSTIEDNELPLHVVSDDINSHKL